ncbi:hypothetical protein BKA65DRAFT_531522 [Rhexocercosporidium sp. MPI-PUGE-AT-0058]|nr:hypothetical protein BKA65DRAFT_531522 [Rhexocercosporidium sp. MPI-PUGE-AT-0058]
MASTTFTPYWRHFGLSRNPYSFVFFVVAQIAGRRRPIAVVSSRGPADPEHGDEIGSLQGFPLIAACQRIITIFSDKTNRTAIKAELSLAAGYYMRDEGHEEYRPEQVELRENDASDRYPRMESDSWDHTNIREFPFITACLLQGVALYPQESYCYQAAPQPLGTVYRDISIEYGMVVIDITDLSALRYGVVGFATMPMMWVPSAEAFHRQTGPVGSHVPPSNSGGEMRVLDQARSRAVMSAAEYLTKFPGPDTIPEPPEGEEVKKLLARIPLVHSDALEIIWPSGSEYDIALPMADLSIGTKKSLHEQAIRSLFQSTIDVENFNISIFDDVRKVPNFKEMLQRNLLQYSNRLGNTQSAGILLRLAFADGEHLYLEQLDNISVEAISAAVNIPELGTISSISICTSTMRNLSPKLMEGLSKSESLREIYLMQSPLRKADTPDVELLEALATRPHFFSRVKVTFAGSYSAALRKIFWLPTISKNTSTSASTIQTAPLSIFPIQQILISYQITRGTPYKTASVYLGDSLLTPERFAAGFLTYLHSSKSNFPVKEDFNSSARLFSFSSAPASLTSSSLSSVEISPIPAESFAIGDDNIPDDIRPKIRDLSPDGWTVLITSGKGWNPKASKQETKSSCGHVRYAIIRPRKQTIEVENPPSTPLGRDELEVVGLKEFLTITAPDVDLEPVDRRLGEIAECCEPGYRQGVMPGSITPVHVLKHEGAAEMLLTCLRDARDLNENLRRAMKKNLGGQPWYPELLQTSSDTR